MPGNKGSRYVYAPKHITDVLEKIHKLGRPNILTFEYMKKTWLIKNKQYSAVLPLLRDMEFIDASGHPLDSYNKYQNPTIAQRILAEGIKKAYPNLFQAYPNAYMESKGTIEGYFKEHTGAEKAVLDKITSTFFTLCKDADFSELVEASKEKEDQKAVKYLSSKSAIGDFQLEPNIQINIEIHIAADTPDDKIETIFKNMRLYLFPNR